MRDNHTGSSSHAFAARHRAPVRHGNTFRRGQDGVVLLYSLLLLTVMAIIAVVISSLVFREISVSRTFDDSLEAFYAAESGIELGLDVLGQRRENSDSLSGAIADIEGAAIPNTPITLTHSGASYYIEPTSTSASVETLTATVPLHTGIQIELYDADDSLNTNSVAADSMQFIWGHPSCTEQSRIEVTFAEFSGTATDVEIDKQIFTCGNIDIPDSDCAAISNVPSPAKNYVVRVKALDCSIHGLEVSAYDQPDAALGFGSRISFPSRPRVTSIGVGELSRRSMTAYTKWVPSASGFVDFVLFSLEPVTKE